jgi:hypothetical protein
MYHMARTDLCLAIRIPSFPLCRPQHVLLELDLAEVLALPFVDSAAVRDGDDVVATWAVAAMALIETALREWVGGRGVFLRAMVLALTLLLFPHVAENWGVVGICVQEVVCVLLQAVGRVWLFGAPFTLGVRMIW